MINFVEVLFHPLLLFHQLVVVVLQLPKGKAGRLQHTRVMQAEKRQTQERRGDISIKEVAKQDGRESEGRE